MSRARPLPLVALFLRDALSRLARQHGARLAAHDEAGSAGARHALATLAHGLPHTRMAQLRASIAGAESWRLSDEARQRVARQRIANALAAALLENEDLYELLDIERLDKDGSVLPPSVRAKDVHEFRYSLRLLLVPANDPPEKTDA